MAQNGLNSKNPFETDLSSLNAMRAQSETTIGRETVKMVQDIADPSQKTSVLTDMLGRNPVESPAVEKASSPASLSVDQKSAKQTQVNATAAVGAKQDLSAHIENTVQQTEMAQDKMRSQLDEAFDNLSGADGMVRDDMGNGYTKADAQRAFAPANDGMSDETSLAAGLAGGKELAKASLIADAAKSMGPSPTKLPLKVQNRLSEEMAKIQFHDAGTPPAMKTRIAHAWNAAEAQKAEGWAQDQKSALTELYEEALQDPEQFPEIQYMRNLESDLEAVIAEHEYEAPSVAIAAQAEDQGIYTDDFDRTIQLRDDVENVSIALRDNGYANVKAAVAPEITGIVAALEKNAKTPDPVFEIKKPEIETAFAPA